MSSRVRLDAAERVESGSAAGRPDAPGPLTCVCCGAAAFAFAWRIAERTLVRCRVCGLVRQVALPSPEALAALYSSERYYRNPAFHSGDPTHLYGYADGSVDPRLRELAFDRCVAPALRTHAPASRAGLRWLDLGCGLGELVHFARREGFDAVGVDPNPAGVASARAAWGGAFRVGSWDALAADERFDVISLFDVVEHVLDPEAFLCTARRHLVPGGLLLLVTPDLGGPVARLLGPRLEDVRRVSEHFFLFSRGNLPQLARRCGLEVLETRTIGAVLPLRELAARAAAMLRLARPWRASGCERWIPAGATVYVDPGVKMLAVARATGGPA